VSNALWGFETRLLKMTLGFRRRASYRCDDNEDGRRRLICCGARHSVPCCEWDLSSIGVSAENLVHVMRAGRYSVHFGHRCEPVLFAVLLKVDRC